MYDGCLMAVTGFRLFKGEISVDGLILSVKFFIHKIAYCFVNGSQKDIIFIDGGQRNRSFTVHVSLKCISYGPFAEEVKNVSSQNWSRTCFDENIFFLKICHPIWPFPTNFTVQNGNWQLTISPYSFMPSVYVWCPLSASRLCFCMYAMLLSQICRLEIK